MSQSLPDRPNLEHLRKQAKDLLSQARAEDAHAASTLSKIAEPPHILAHAQLAVARSYGFDSWPKLIAEAERIRAVRGVDEDAADRFVKLCLTDRLSSIRRMMELYPGIGGFNPVCALVSADVPAIRSWLTPDRARVKLGPESWEPIEYVCYSRISQAETSRSEAQLEVARRLVEAGADPNTSHLWGESAPVSILFAAGSEAKHPGIAKLLLDHGATPDDGESVFHGAQHDQRDFLEALLAHGADISGRDARWGNTPLYFNAGHRPSDPNGESAMRGIYWLLDHGADPNVPCASNGETPLHAICMRGWGGDIVRMFLEHGANPDAKRNDGRTPYAIAALTGNVSAMKALQEAGADTALSPDDAYLSALAQGGPRASRHLPVGSGVLLVKLAENGSLDGVRGMLDAGVPVESTGEAGGTALHFACLCGHSDLVDLLLGRGAPLEIRDGDYDATPLGWALFAMAHMRNPTGDYIRLIRSLLAAGASRQSLLDWLSGDEAPEDLQQVLHS